MDTRTARDDSGRLQIDFDTRQAVETAVELEAEAERLQSRVNDLRHTAKLLRRYVTDAGPCPRCS